MVAEAVRDFPMFIDGAPAEASSGAWLEVRSPATRAVVGRVPSGSEADVDRAVAAARAAFEDGRWSRRYLPERVAILSRLADLIEEHADELARWRRPRPGSAYKLRRDSDLPFTVDNLRFFAGAVRHLEGKAAYEYSGSHTSFVRREPIGRRRAGVPVELPALDGDLEDRPRPGGRQLGRPEARHAPRR